MEELERCPFCGGKAGIRRYGLQYPLFHAECEKCGAKTGYYSGYDEELAVSHAVRAWNKRSGMGTGA